MRIHLRNALSSEGRTRLLPSSCAAVARQEPRPPSRGSSISLAAQLCTAAIAAAFLLGCGQTAPTMSGGKPIRHWLEAAHNPDPKWRKEAMFKLGNVGSTDPAAFPAVLGGLKDQDAKVRCEAILALLKFGPESKEAIPILTKIQQNDPDDTARSYAAKALTKLQASK